MAKKIWCAYIHIPGGQIGTFHTEDHQITKRTGDQEETIKFTAVETIEAFKKQKNIAVNIMDPKTHEVKLTMHQVLIWPGDDLSDNPDAALVVEEWAKLQGLVPLMPKADQKGMDPKTYEYDKRITSLEGDVKEIKNSLGKILEAVGAAK